MSPTLQYLTHFLDNPTKNLSIRLLLNRIVLLYSAINCISNKTNDTSLFVINIKSTKTVLILAIILKNESNLEI